MYKAADQRYDQLKVRHAGQTGLMLPPISLGLWRHYGSNDPLKARQEVILHAFDQGVFHFDVANNYGNNGTDFGSTETLLGQVLSTDLKAYRDELVISTKAGYLIHEGPFGFGTSRKSMLQGIDDSLRRLQLDYVDIFYAHRFDDTTPIAETVRALDDIVRQGKALYVGISNYETPQAQQAIALFKQLGTPFVLDQMSYNMLNPHVVTSGLTQALADAGAGLIAYGPLCEGLLSERYLKGIPEDFPIHHTNSALFAQGKPAVVAKLNQLNQLAQGRGQTLSQMALAWLLRDQVVASVIIGTTSVAHLDDNLQALNNSTFTADELDQIDTILK
ncbi:aldo/keto reductase [Loigolactobacillus jiayinensis]|uniref:Aldo/keto reductase n=1 Tax=Loigolactobacillus jiayinensis TaxID=2486016 RepID=A0ABW1RF78_9LACO|nr:aldo/keto reductase [Loigolactobacillus jiayinensis]